MSEQKPARRFGFSTYVLAGFALIGVLAAGAVIFLAAIIYSSMPDRQPESKVAGKAPSEQYSVQSVEDLRGTDLVRIDIGIGTDAGRNPYGSSGGGADQRNLILLDRRTGANRRLLTDNSRHIEQSWFFPAVAEAPAADDGAKVVEYDAAPTVKAPPSPPYAYYVLAVRQRDGQTMDLLVGDLASGNQAFVVSGIEGIDKIWMLSPTRVAVLMREKLQLHYRVIDIPTLKVVTAHRLEIG